MKGVFGLAMHIRNLTCGRKAVLAAIKKEHGISMLSKTLSMGVELVSGD